MVDEQEHDAVIEEEVPLRRSQRMRKPTISDDYIVYLQEHEFVFCDDNDPVTFQEAISSSHASEWLAAM